MIWSMLQLVKSSPKRAKKVTPRAVKKLIDEGKVTELLVPFDHIVGKFVAQDIINEETGAIYVEAGDELTLIRS